MENKNFWEGTEIAALPDNGVFVFGSNPGGIHGAGAAKAAETLFGAQRYVGRGMTGSSYALVTKNLKAGFVERSTGITYEKEGYRSVSRPMIVDNIADLYNEAVKNPDLYYFVAYTENGATWPNGKPKGNLNGYTNHEMAEMFIEAGNGDYPENIIFNESYEVLLDRAKVLYEEWVAGQVKNNVPQQPVAQASSPVAQAPTVVKRSGGFQPTIKAAERPVDAEQSFDDMPQNANATSNMQGQSKVNESPKSTEVEAPQRPRSTGFQPTVKAVERPIEAEQFDDMPRSAEAPQPVVSTPATVKSVIDDNFDDMPQSVSSITEEKLVEQKVEVLPEVEPVIAVEEVSPALLSVPKKKEFNPYPNVPLVEDLDDQWGEGLVPDVFLDTNPENIFMRSFYQVDESGTVIGKIKAEEVSHDPKTEVVGKVRAKIIPPELRNPDGTLKVIEKKVEAVDVPLAKTKAKAKVVTSVKEDKPVAIVAENIAPILSPSEISESEQVPPKSIAESVVNPGRAPSTTLEQDGRTPFVRLKDMPQAEREKVLGEMETTDTVANVSHVKLQEQDNSPLTSVQEEVREEAVTPVATVQEEIKETPIIAEKLEQAPEVVSEVKTNPEVQRKQESLPNAKDYTFFFHLTSEFSNFHPSKFESDGIVFCSNEQYMMLSKAYRFGDMKTFDAVLEINERAIVKDFLSGKITKEQILGNRDWSNAWNEVQKSIKALGRDVTPYDDKVWSEERLVCVREGLVLKFSQNPDLLEKLLSTKNTRLVEASAYDKVWGIGLNKESALKTFESQWPGENNLGVLLDSVREELSLTIVSAPLSKPVKAEAEPVKAPLEIHPDNVDKTFFYSLYSPFSNFHPAAFVYKDIEFSSSEQFYMFAKAKFTKNEDAAKTIMSVNQEPLVRDFLDGKVTKKEILNQYADEWFKLTMKIKAVGRTLATSGEIKEVWDSKKDNIMKVAVKEKFSQNNDLSQQLLKTDGTLLVEASKKDIYWGAGVSKDEIKLVAPSDWPGQNRLGNIVTELREVLKVQMTNQESPKTGFKPK